jgi:hypothetical protein
MFYFALLVEVGPPGTALPNRRRSGRQYRESHRRHGRCFLDIQDRGNIVVYNTSDVAKWATYDNWDSSFAHGAYSALMYGMTLTEGN